MKQDIAGDLALLSKKDAFDLLFQTFDYLIQLQQILVAHKALIVLMNELNEHNDVEFEEIQNG